MSSRSNLKERGTKTAKGSGLKPKFIHRLRKQPKHNLHTEHGELPKEGTLAAWAVPPAPGATWAQGCAMGCRTQEDQAHSRAKSPRSLIGDSFRWGRLRISPWSKHFEPCCAEGGLEVVNQKVVGSKPVWGGLTGQSFLIFRVLRSIGIQWRRSGGAWPVAATSCLFAHCLTCDGTFPGDDMWRRWREGCLEHQRQLRNHGWPVKK
jgi:hypothetical protein